MINLEVGMFQTLAIAVLAIYFGDYMRDKFSVLKRYCIPSPVVGGTIFAVVTTIFFSSGLLGFKFDYTTMNTFFYNVFFAATGLAASLSLLKKGGKLVIIFTILAALLAFLQNVLALGVGAAMGMNPLVALMAGSVPLTGGHGNAASFGPLAESMGGTGALEVAIAAATFGLIAGCIMGGPLGRRLIQKYGLNSTSAQIEADEGATSTVKALVNSKRAHKAVFILLLACGLGQTLFALCKVLLPSVHLPIHVMSMFGGIILRLILDAKKQNHDELYQSIDIVGGISLSIFVSLSIVTMKLWQLADLALPLITILALQLVLIYLFCVYITFRACGKNYDAAIISVGHSGFGLGAVPVSMATMSAVCSQYHYSRIAFFVVPLIGGFISNITNAVIITAFLNVAKGML
ncbi:sodium/glutamate symporter [Campylobacter geochelonis]|uniref:Sodium/glutamate symporter n=1 Tax=Campylobacter geochelonis TaxID=1780362 RepID=A0A128EJT8_9BACT|nr:sodium/glutamate symporter [Campylobacter geochelonis]QKF70758.1 sodium:glutamate symport carrier protein [Campylobacter geochelonis]CZE48608.1 sodium/glutamate symporter [Campylobacter geochelonis]